jgi:hypothetical protein
MTLFRAKRIEYPAVFYENYWVVFQAAAGKDYSVGDL